MACIGHALRDLGRLDDAIAAYDTALALRPDYGDALGNRAQTLLMRGDYAAGWRHYEQRFLATGTQPRSIGAAAWRGEPLAGRTVAVLSEQGIGDEIMFASCLPDLLAVAGRVVVACEPRLLPLFARSFPRATVRARDETPVAADCEISIGSLPLHFRPARNSFSQTAGYLQADPARVGRWRSAYGNDKRARRIGIAWRGGTLRNRQYLRSFDLAELAPLLRRPGCEFVSLQFGDRRQELDLVHRQCDIAVRDVAGETGADIDELAAAIAALDLVITVDNTIAHLAGALGRPVWILLPFSAEWRYGRDGETIDWYPSARLFRQRAPRDWAAVIARVAQSLAAGEAACSSN